MNDLLTEFLRVLRSGEVPQAIRHFRAGDARCVAGLGFEIAGATWHAADSRDGRGHRVPYYTDQDGNEVWQDWLDVQLDVSLGTMCSATDMNNSKIGFPELANYIEGHAL